LIPSYYQDGEDAYFMRKMLPAASANAPNGYGHHHNPFFGKKGWQTGDSELRLPRTHFPHQNVDDDAEKQPELLTGTM
jgi:hypothetical protein